MKPNAAVRRRWDINPAYQEWHNSRKIQKAVTEIANGLCVTEATAFLLYGRGYETLSRARAFLDTSRIAFRDPYLLPDMDIAVERILEAIDRTDKIAIYGDYDVDGVTSVAVLYLYLKSLGADVSYYIPCRSGEGYGVSECAIKSLSKNGVKLIVTVDTGITACREVEYAASLGVEMIITDHHECHCELPKASAVINDRRPDSRYPYREFAGVGVVFKLVTAIEIRLKGTPDVTDSLCERFADLVAIGTVADVMPLTDENRLIVATGLKCIEKHPRPGITALLEKAGVADGRRVNSMLIGFVIAPRINAAGRIANASKAVELLLTESQGKANAIALELCETNSERQQQEHRIVTEAKAKIEAEFDFARDRVIVLADDSWHHGVIGIVASRITEKFNRPSILISFDGGEGDGGEPSDTDVGKGSGRSIKGMNLVGALSDCSNLLLKFGGHELAAGLSIERGNLNEFRRAINEYAAKTLTDDDLVTTIAIDSELTDRDLNMRQAEELRLLEPYGVANPSPVFMLRDAKITELTAIGNGRHSRLTLKRGEVSCSAVFFGRSPATLNVYVGDCVDVVFNLDVNEFNGNKNVQLVLRDIRLCEAERMKLAAERELYKSLRDGIIPEGDETAAPVIVPTREDFAAVYTFVKRECARGENDIYIRAITNATCGKVGYIKIRFICDVLNELGILSAEPFNPDTDLFRFKIIPTSAKVCIDKSCLLKKLKKLYVRTNK